MSIVYYGVDGKEKEVTEVFKSLVRLQAVYLLNPLLHGEKNSYNSLLGDPAPGRKKRIKVVRAGRHYYFNEDVPLDLNFIVDDYNSFDWVTYVLNYPELNFIKNQVNAVAHLQEYGKREGRVILPLWTRNGSITLSTSKPLFTRLISLFYTVFLAYYSGREVIICEEEFSCLDILELQKLVKEKAKVSLLVKKKEGEKFSSQSDNLIDLLLEINHAPLSILVEDPLPGKDISFHELEEKIYFLLSQVKLKVENTRKVDLLLCPKKSKENILSFFLAFALEKEKSPLLIRSPEQWKRKYAPGVEMSDEIEEFSLSREADNFIGLERAELSCRIVKLRKALNKPSLLLRLGSGGFYLCRE